MNDTPVFRRSLEDTAAAIADGLAADGFHVCRDFLSPAVLADLRTRLRLWWEEGELRRAAIGRGEKRKIDDDIRGDYVRWIDTDSNGVFAEFFAAHYEPIRLALNRELQLGLWDYEGHVTVYPPGRFYARHIDRFTDAAHRKVSCILYLNEDWLPAEGGELRLYLPDVDGYEQSQDVLPEGGTLVTFLSDRFPHEVLPATRERFSLTGWFCTRR